ncbi:uncharacterized protein BKA55DRAFT_681596 [Fusarium redolens]|uniref:Uncharacterized protein n=1 Tax=Fusarium redolens TaxID=48865 RepID=A0A9P9FXI5_FUSRE|nr:uncharacterized protein BKA55DRAFT_681596 [Fusarium redolens]KAH7208423.1 hypothetical protein BKA55DRAFT_681596 [Fusarium redolens]
MNVSPDITATRAKLNREETGDMLHVGSWSKDRHKRPIAPVEKPPDQCQTPFDRLRVSVIHEPGLQESRGPVEHLSKDKNNLWICYECKKSFQRISVLEVSERVLALSIRVNPAREDHSEKIWSWFAVPRTSFASMFQHKDKSRGDAGLDSAPSGN